MRKAHKALLSMLLCILFLFAGCAAPAISTETTTVPPETTTVEAEETTLPDPNAEVTISDEVIDLVEDTDEKVEQGEDIGTDEVIEGDIKDEQEINDEGLLETDGTVEQEDISYDGTNTGKGTSLLSGAAKLTYYSQADSRWGYILYTNHGDKSQTIKSSGCGPTSAAMVISASKGIITPPTVAQLFKDNGYRTYSNGTAWSAWSFVADYFDFNEYHATTSFSTMSSYLKQDKNKDGVADYFVVCSCGSGLFTTGGHYIFLAGDKNGTITVYDPYYYYGKFNTASRKAAGVKVDGNIAYVSESSFQKYGAVKQYWVYSNDSNVNTSTNTETTTEKPTESTSTKTMYVTASWLNVRKGPGTNYAAVDCYKNGTKVSVYETKSGWSRIGTNKWVSSKYLSTKKSTSSSSSSTPTVAYIYVPATGRYAYCKYSAIEKYNGYYRLKSRTTLYSKSNLTGTQYNYLAKTKVEIRKTI